MTPAKLGLGRTAAFDDGIPEPPTKHKGNPNRDVAGEHAARIRAAVEAARSALQKAQEYQSKYYNRRHQVKEYEADDEVMLSTRNLRSTRPNKKLDYKYTGPFSIAERVGSQAYRLVLPPSLSRIHPVFHVSLLEPYRRGTGPAPPGPVGEMSYDADTPEREYEVKEILSERTKGSKVQYLVRWTGYGPADDTWVDQEDMGNAKAVVEQYRRRTGTKPGRRRAGKF